MRAMILAAGRGERMRPLTDTCPKPLLEIAHKPLIVWHIERLVASGITEIVINHAHLGVQIEQALRSGERWGAKIQYSAEAQALETAGGIAQALPLLGSAPFLVINGDIFCDIDFAAVAAHAQKLSPTHLAHLILVANPTHNPAGDFSLDGPWVQEEGAAKYTFSGVGAYHPNLFLSVKHGQRAALAPLLKNAMRNQGVTGELHTGRWTDVGTPTRLAELNAEFNPE